MSSRKVSFRFGLTGLALLVVAAVASAQSAPSSQSAPSAKARYPYDPACAWGRVANGKGMLVRCLTEGEAVALVKGGAVPSGTASAAAPTDKPPQPEKPAEEPATSKPLKVEVGPITADKGKLSIGRLHVPKDRYAECVEKNGGIDGADAEVHVRFLVRGDRSRAEGVSVSKRRNMSKEAAQCVAGVVDRRRVGTPDSPMVGATLVIKFTR